MNRTTAVVASGFQRALFSFHANSRNSQQTILRKSRFQVSKQNDQDLEVVWFDWQS